MFRQVSYSKQFLLPRTTPVKIYVHAEAMGCENRQPMTPLTPLSFDAKNYKNWEQITRGQANLPLKASHWESLDLDLPWITSIRSTVESIGCLDFFVVGHSSKPPFVYKKCSNGFLTFFTRKPLLKSIVRGVNLERPRLRKWSGDIKNNCARKNVTKFRPSNHKLIDVQQSFCSFCPNAIEDELHFPLYPPFH